MTAMVSVSSPRLKARVLSPRNNCEMPAVRVHVPTPDERSRWVRDSRHTCRWY